MVGLVGVTTLFESGDWDLPVCRSLWQKRQQLAFCLDGCQKWEPEKPSDKHGPKREDKLISAAAQ